MCRYDDETYALLAPRYLDPWDSTSGSYEQVLFALKKEIHVVLVYRVNIDEAPLILNLRTKR